MLSWTRRLAKGSGTQAPSMSPVAKVCRVCAFSCGTMWTSPPPLVSVLRPFSCSQWRSATSWVLPSCGVAIFLPLRSSTVLISGLTTRKTPPEAAPAMMLIALPPDLDHALMAGFGPM